MGVIPISKEEWEAQHAAVPPNAVNVRGESDDASARPREAVDKGPVADFLTKNFGPDLVKLQKDYEESLKHPEKADAFDAEMKAKFREFRDSPAAKEANILRTTGLGIQFQDPSGGVGPGIGTRGASETPGATVNVSALAAKLQNPAAVLDQNAKAVIPTPLPPSRSGPG